MAPLGLARHAAGARGLVAVHRHVLLVEVGAGGVVALAVDGQLLHQLLEAAAVLGVPAHVLQFGQGHALLLGVLHVDQERHRVPVLGQAVLLGIAAPGFVQAAGVDVGLDLVARDQRAQVQQLGVARELGILGQVVGEHVGRGARDETGRDRGPVVVPARLRDLDADAGIGFLEVGRALLVGRQLVGVPQRVLHFRRAGRGAGQGQRHEGQGWLAHRLSPCLRSWWGERGKRKRDRGSGGGHLPPLNCTDSTTRRPNASSSKMVGSSVMAVAAIRPVQSGWPCGVCDLNDCSATGSTCCAGSLATR